MTPKPSKSGRFRKKLVAKLLQKWNFLCLVCGRPFTSYQAITIEHILPHSRSHGMYENLSLSHHVCNLWKRNGSLLLAARKIDEALKGLPDERSRTYWLNRDLRDKVNWR